MGTQILWLFILAIPIACISWTVTHETIFLEPREFCRKSSEKSKTWLRRKFFYVFTCEYCFSHYVTIFFLILSKYTLLFSDWRGYLIAGFSLVWVANLYISLYALLRTDLKKEGIEAKSEEQKLENEGENTPT